MGFAERRAEGIWARRFGRQSIQRAGCLIPSSHDLACLVEPLAIHLDPTEPSGDMDYAFSLRSVQPTPELRTRRSGVRITPGAPLTPKLSVIYGEIADWVSYVQNRTVPTQSRPGAFHRRARVVFLRVDEHNESGTCGGTCRLRSARFSLELVRSGFLS